MPPTAGSEPPQVGGGSNIISLLTSSDVERGAAEPRRRKRLDRAGAVTVPGTVFFPVSRRGLRHRVVLVRRCPFCSEAHSFRDCGLRIASCGHGYLIVKGRRARRPQAEAA